MSGEIGVDTVGLKFEVLQAREAQQQIAKTAGEVEHVTHEVEAGGAAAKRASEKYRGFTRGIVSSGDATRAARPHLMGYVKGLAGIAAGYLSITAAKDAVSTTEDFGRESLMLQQTLGLNATAADAMAAHMHVAGVEFHQGNQSLGILARTAGTATDQYTHLGASIAAQTKKVAQLRSEHDALGLTQRTVAKRQRLDLDIQREQAKLLLLNTGHAGTQADAFQQLGVSQSMLASGDTNAIFEQVTQGLHDMKGGTDKTRIAMTLFGRGWQALQPIIKDGKAGIDDANAQWQKFGVTIDKTQLQKYIQEQHEMHYAILALSITFGTKLMPALTQAEYWLARVIGSTHDSSSAASHFGSVMHLLGDTIGGTIGFLAHHEKVLSATIDTVTILTGAYVGWKAGMMITGTVNALTMSMEALTGATGAATDAQLGLDAAELANPIGLALAGVAALGVGFGLLYERNKTFRHGVDDTMRGVRAATSATTDFLSHHWKDVGAVMAGPFVALPSLVALHYGDLERRTAALPGELKAAAPDVFGFLRKGAVYDINEALKYWTSVRFENKIAHVTVGIGGGYLKKAYRVGQDISSSRVGHWYENTYADVIGGKKNVVKPVSRTLASPAPAVASNSTGSSDHGWVTTPIVVNLDGKVLADSNAKVQLKTKNRR